MKFEIRFGISDVSEFWNDLKQRIENNIANKTFIHFKTVRSTENELRRYQRIVF